MASRETVKSNIQTLNVPSVSNDDLEDMLNDNICDNVRFKEHSTKPAVNPGSSSFGINFTGFDSVVYNKTGSSVIINGVTGLAEGQTGFLTLNKSAGQTVSFSGITDMTVFTELVTPLSSVNFIIKRKNNVYYALAMIKDVAYASTFDGITGTNTTRIVNSDVLQYVARQKSVVRSSSGGYTVASNVGFISINNGVNNVAITLPSVSTFAGHKIYIACAGASSGSTVTGTGLSGTVAILSSNNLYVCISNGSKWFKTNLGQIDNAEGLACPFVYINGIYFDEILKNIVDIDGEETLDVSSDLKIGENKLTISEEKSEITYIKKLYFNDSLIAENLILHEGDKKEIEIVYEGGKAELKAIGHYIYV